MTVRLLSLMLTLSGVLPALPAGYLEALRQAGSGNYRIAFQKLQLCLQSNPDFAPAYSKLAEVSRAGQLEAELSALWQAMLAQPATAPYGHFGLAAHASRRRDAVSTAHHAEAAVKDLPHFMPAHALWNRALIALKNTATASNFYAQRLAKNPDDETARFARHHLRLWAREGSTADLEQLKRISLIRPADRSFAESWMLSEYNWGSAERALDAARDVLSRAQQQKDPDLAYNAASYAAELLHRRGDLRQAEVLAGQTAVTAREFGDRSIESLMWLRLCIARTDLNKLHLARDACTAAAKAAEPDPALASYASDSWARLADLFFRGGQAEEALGAMDRAVETATRGPVQFARHTRQVDAAKLSIHSASSKALSRLRAKLSPQPRKPVSKPCKSMRSAPSPAPDSAEATTPVLKPTWSRRRPSPSPQAIACSSSGFKPRWDWLLLRLAGCLKPGKRLPPPSRRLRIPKTCFCCLRF